MPSQAWSLSSSSKAKAYGPFVRWIVALKVRTEAIVCRSSRKAGKVRCPWRWRSPGFCRCAAFWDQAQNQVRDSCQVLFAETVIDQLGLFTGLDEACFPEYAQLLRKRWLANPCSLFDLADVALTFAQNLKDSQTERMRNCLQFFDQSLTHFRFPFGISLRNQAVSSLAL